MLVERGGTAQAQRLPSAGVRGRGADGVRCRDRARGPLQRNGQLLPRRRGPSRWAGSGGITASRAAIPLGHCFPRRLSRDDMIRVHQFWNLDPEIRPTSTTVDSALSDAAGQPDHERAARAAERLRQRSSIGSRTIRSGKTPNLARQEDRNSAPMLMINSWYDISIGPNVAMFEHQVKDAATESARNDSRMIIAPTLHCSQMRRDRAHHRGRARHGRCPVRLRRPRPGLVRPFPEGDGQRGHAEAAAGARRT